MKPGTSAVIPLTCPPHTFAPHLYTLKNSASVTTRKQISPMVVTTLFAMYLRDLAVSDQVSVHITKPAPEGVERVMLWIQERISWWLEVCMSRETGQGHPCRKEDSGEGRKQRRRPSWSHWQKTRRGRREGRNMIGSSLHGSSLYLFVSWRERWWMERWASSGR